MTKPFCVSSPINSLSFGAVSCGILREIYKRGLSPAVFPIGQPDLSAQKPDEDFVKRLQASINDAQSRHTRDHTAFKLWHPTGSLETYSRRDSRLITFFELDGLTPTEVSILRSQDRVYVTSRYTQDTFKQYDIASEYLPLGFDAHNFHQLDKRPLIDSVTTFCLGGKLEKRKGHLKVLNLWAKRYGNDMRYRLNCALHNPFMKDDQVKAMIAQALEGKTYANINWLPFMPTNAEYNSFLQSGQIFIAMSGGEGKGLPEYHAAALGAWPVALKAHAYLDYFNDENAVLVRPNNKVPAADGVFFGASGPFNIGNIFDFDGAEFIAACEEAERRAATGINTNGLKLQQLTYKDTVDVLLKDLA